MTTLSKYYGLVYEELAVIIKNGNKVQKILEAEDLVRSIIVDGYKQKALFTDTAKLIKKTIK